jgi:hypothetical protein
MTDLNAFFRKQSMQHSCTLVFSAFIDCTKKKCFMTCIDTRPFNNDLSSDHDNSDNMISTTRDPVKLGSPVRVHQLNNSFVTT